MECPESTETSDINLVVQLKAQILQHQDWQLPVLHINLYCLYSVSIYTRKELKFSRKKVRMQGWHKKDRNKGMSCGEVWKPHTARTSPHDIPSSLSFCAIPTFLLFLWKLFILFQFVFFMQVCLQLSLISILYLGQFQLLISYN